MNNLFRHGKRFLAAFMSVSLLLSSGIGAYAEELEQDAEVIVLSADDGQAVSEQVEQDFCQEPETATDPLVQDEVAESDLTGTGEAGPETYISREEEPETRLLPDGYIAPPNSANSTAPVSFIEDMDSILGSGADVEILEGTIENADDLLMGTNAEEYLKSMPIKDLNGVVHYISEYIKNNTYVIVLFGRSTCGNTKAMLKTAAQARDSGKSLKIVLMDVDAVDSGLKALTDQYGAVASINTYNNNYRSNLMHYQGIGGTTLPTTFVMDNNTKIVYASTGPQTLELERVLGGADSTKTSTFNFRMTYGQSEARTMLSSVNSFRTGNEAWAWNADNETKSWYNVGTLEYDYGLEQIAMKRAAEIAVMFDHMRPNGEMCNTAYTYNAQDYGENIAAGNYMATANDAYVGWREDDEDFDGQGHRRNMLDGGYRYIGIGHVVFNGCHYWVQEFGYNPSGQAFTDPENNSQDVPIAIRDIWWKATEIRPTSNKAIQLEVGRNAPLPAVSTMLQVKGTFPSGAIPTSPERIPWVSANTGIATVADGMTVYAKSGGNTKVTATNRGMSCTLDIVVKIHVTGIALDRKEASMVVGDKVTIGATITPANATDKFILWESSNTKVAGVDYTGTVIANGAGTAVITATTSDGNKTATCTVNVRQRYPDSAVVKGVVHSLYVGDIYTFTAELTPANTVESGVTWSCSDESILQTAVEGTKCRVTGKKPGTVSFTIKLQTNRSTSTRTFSVRVDERPQDSNGDAYQPRNVDYAKVREFVTRMYSKMLARNPDASGVDYWTEMLVSGEQNGSGVAKGFVNSDELKNSNISDEEFVLRLYRTFFDNEGDASGKAYWINKLKQGYSRLYVFRGFAVSDQFTGICANYGIERGGVPLSEKDSQRSDENLHIDQQKVTGYIDRLYRTILGRGGDAAGSSYWINRIMNREEKAASVAMRGFFHSDEYLNANKSDEEFIKDLYRSMLGREADPAGIEYWKEQLRTGKYTRDRLIQHGFGNSNEFNGILQGYGLKMVD